MNSKKKKKKKKKIIEENIFDPALKKYVKSIKTEFLFCSFFLFLKIYNKLRLVDENTSPKASFSN